MPGFCNNPVHFDKTIYVDRFLEKNQEFRKSERKSLTKYEEHIERLKEGIEKYKSYGEYKMDIREVLKTTIDFIKSSQKDEIALVDLFEGNQIIYDPAGIAKQEHPESVIKSLESSLLQAKKQVEKMEKTLSDYNNIASAQTQVHRYDLHSILMHGGGPESGHYYSYIYDFKRKIWRKYNDKIVTEETEENVFKEAIGDGKSSVNAYYLVYLAKNSREYQNSSIIEFPLISGSCNKY